MNQYSSTPFDERSYDANGNLIVIDRAPADGTSDVEMAYDYRNQMVRYRELGSGVTTTYTYDALGRRIGKVVDDGTPETTRFFYDRWREIEEQDGTGTTRATYVYGIYLDELLQMRRGGNDFFFHSDDLYSVAAVSDANGNVVERYAYGDFGAPTILDPNGAPRAGSAIGNPYLYTGRRYDPESGFYYYRIRYLDPRTGRFTVVDPLGIWFDRDNLGNGYSYAGNNPLRSLDPFGLAAAPAALPVIEVTAEMIVGEMVIIEGGSAAAGAAGGGAAAGGGTAAGGAAAVGVGTAAAAVVAAAAVGVAIGTVINHFAEDWIQARLDDLFGDENMPDPYGNESADTEIDQPPVDEPLIDQEPIQDPNQQPDGNQQQQPRRRCRRSGGGFSCTVTCTFAPKPGCEGQGPCPPGGNFTGWSNTNCVSACANAKRAARQNMPAHCVANCN
jgi:RHS repeat-associated protein